MLSEAKSRWNGIVRQPDASAEVRNFASAAFVLFSFFLRFLFYLFFWIKVNPLPRIEMRVERGVRLYRCAFVTGGRAVAGGHYHVSDFLLLHSRHNICPFSISVFPPCDHGVM